MPGVTAAAAYTPETQRMLIGAAGTRHIVSQQQQGWAALRPASPSVCGLASRYKSVLTRLTLPLAVARAHTHRARPALPNPTRPGHARAGACVGLLWRECADELIMQLDQRHPVQHADPARVSLSPASLKQPAGLQRAAWPRAEEHRRRHPVCVARWNRGRWVGDANVSTSTGHLSSGPEWSR